MQRKETQPPSVGGVPHTAQFHHKPEVWLPQGHRRENKGDGGKWWLLLLVGTENMHFKYCFNKGKFYY